MREIEMIGKGNLGWIVVGLLFCCGGVIRSVWAQVEVVGSGSKGQALAAQILDFEVQPLEAMDPLEQALNVLDAGRQRAAEELVYAAVMQESTNGPLLLAHGVMLLSRGERASAHGLFRLMQQADFKPGMEENVRLAYSILNGEKASEMALETLTQHATEQQHIFLEWLVALLCLEERQYEQAERQIRSLLDKFTVGPVQLHHAYAELLTNPLERIEKALEHRKIALELERQPKTLVGMGRTLISAGRTEEALPYLHEAVQADPMYAFASQSLAWAYRKNKQYEKAVEASKQAIKSDPLHTGADWYRIGQCYHHLKNEGQMVLAWRQAARAGDEKAYRRLLGYWFFEQHDRQRAYALMRQWTGYERDLDAVCAVALQLSKTNAKHALAYAKEALSRAPDGWQNLGQLARVFASLKDVSLRDYDEALRLAKAAVSAERNTFTLGVLADVYAARNEPDRATQVRAALAALHAEPVKERAPKKSTPWLTLLLLVILFVEGFYIKRSFRAARSQDPGN